MKLTLLTPERTIAKQISVDLVGLTGSEGMIEILPGHVSMLGTFDPGMFYYQTTGTKSGASGFISTGFFEVSGDEIQVVGEVLELTEEIDVERAKKAHDRAAQKLKEPGLTTEEMRKHELKLQRAMVRQIAASRRQ